MSDNFIPLRLKSSWSRTK